MDIEAVWTCDVKIGALRRKTGGGNESTREKEERKAQGNMVVQCERRYQGEGTIGEDVYDRATWRRILSHIHPT